MVFTHLLNGMILQVILDLCAMKNSGRTHARERTGDRFGALSWLRVCGGGGEVFTKKTRTWMSQEVGKWLVNGL